MPIYDFTCRDCREPFEKLVRGDSEAAAGRTGGERMPEIRRNRARRLIAPWPQSAWVAPAGSNDGSCSKTSEARRWSASVREEPQPSIE